MDRKQDVEAGIRICKAERSMREHVFRNDTTKRKKKVAEMDVVICLLRNYKKMVPDAMGSLFEGG